MKIAISVWGNSVSTVFDFADRLTIIDVEAGQIKNRSELKFIESAIISKAARLRELGVEVLVCGAISRPLGNMIMASGIKIIPFIKGAVDEVIEAYFAGRLLDAHFLLPGCCPGGWMGRGGGWRHHGGKKGRWR
ncbi:MAG: NifB/NifX family molybdenum-iron cluster-binding protein [Syntrophales bacterium]|nr:NifB/NifX family molybdenum-iron cluster-binding protein [Syntrophales bacterium]